MAGLVVRPGDIPRQVLGDMTDAASELYGMAGTSTQSGDMIDTCSETSPTDWSSEKESTGEVTPSSE